MLWKSGSCREGNAKAIFSVLLPTYRMPLIAGYGEASLILGTSNDIDEIGGVQPYHGCIIPDTTANQLSTTHSGYS